MPLVKVYAPLNIFFGSAPDATSYGQHEYMTSTSSTMCTLYRCMHSIQPM